MQARIAEALGKKLSDVQFDRSLSKFRPILDQPWRTGAACRGEGPDLFHDRAREAQAKRVCAGCPVVTECREWAMADLTALGVCGGLTEAERTATRECAA